MDKETINIAVITGGKSHEVIPFQELFRSFDRINSYIQHLDDFSASPESIRDSYNAVLFYFMMTESPTDDGLPGYCGQPKTALERLAQTSQGVVVLHHALLAYPQWPVWDDLVGIKDRKLTSYQHDEILQIKVADPAHPITQGLSDWALVDETYQMADAYPGNQILLTVDQKNSMTTIAWARHYNSKRVFCLQLGHDHQAWEDRNFREVLQNGIQWSSGH
jgi:hypothetical protein